MTYFACLFDVVLPVINSITMYVCMYTIKMYVCMYVCMYVRSGFHYAVMMREIIVKAIIRL